MSTRRARQRAELELEVLQKGMKQSVWPGLRRLAHKALMQLTSMRAAALIASSSSGLLARYGGSLCFSLNLVHAAQGGGCFLVGLLVFTRNCRDGRLGKPRSYGCILR
jgi:hypothetical protein